MVNPAQALVMPPPGSQEGVLKDLALNLDSITCMEPLLAQHLGNSWGKYYCRAQPVNPGSALCIAPEVELNFPEAVNFPCSALASVLIFLSVVSSYLSTSAEGVADVAQQVMASLSSQLHLGRDAGLVVGQSELFGSPVPSPSLAWPIPLFFFFSAAAALSFFLLLFPTSGRLLDCLAPFISMIPPGKLVNRGV